MIWYYMFIIEERRISNPLLIYLDERTRVRRRKGTTPEIDFDREDCCYLYPFVCFWVKNEFESIMEGRCRDKFFSFSLYICMCRDDVRIGTRERKEERMRERERIGELKKRRIELQFQGSLETSSFLYRESRSFTKVRDF